MSRTKSSRRDFLKRASVDTGAGALAPCFFTSGVAKAESKNDRLNVAAIGTSIYTNRWGHQGEMDGRGAVIGHQAGALGNMVACCDVNRRYAERFASRYEGRSTIYGDYRKLLERNDVEANRHPRSLLCCEPRLLPHSGLAPIRSPSTAPNTTDETRSGLGTSAHVRRPVPAKESPC